MIYVGKNVMLSVDCLETTNLQTTPSACVKYYSDERLFLPYVRSLRWGTLYAALVKIQYWRNAPSPGEVKIIRRIFFDEPTAENNRSNHSGWTWAWFEQSHVDESCPPLMIPRTCEYRQHDEAIILIEQCTFLELRDISFRMSGLTRLIGVS